MSLPDKIEIPVTLSFPWSVIKEAAEFLQVTPSQVEGLIEDETEQNMAIEAKITHSEYDEDLRMLKVQGLCLMPGIYTGMNGLRAEYSHEVILQDGFDLTGRPVGAMHVKGNSGYVEAVEIDEISAYMHIDTMVYDTEDIIKVQNGTYTGFSIDTKVWGRDEGSTFVVMRIGFSEGRVDLVDRPACEDCLFLSNEIVQKEVVNMTDITDEELAELRKAKEDLEKLQIKQAAQNEVKIIKLIKEIKSNGHVTFNAEEFLKASKDTNQKIVMLETLMAELPEKATEEPDPISAPDTGTGRDVTQSIPEIEIDSHDVKTFIRNQFKDVLRLDATDVFDDPFRESFEALLEEESRELINAAGG